VAAVQVLLQAGRLKIAPALPLASVLTREMEQFRSTINLATGHESFEAWRERDHDDLVLAVGLAGWYAEHAPKPTPPLLFVAGVKGWGF
jgi:hypothetical protein